jgi:regulator of replication initiation timing
VSFEQIITELNKAFEGIEGVPPHVLSKILNAFEMLIAQINLLKEENQKLKDENSRLKGEQGKPEVRKQTKSGKDTSSESERAPRAKPKKKRLKKKGMVSVDRTEGCAIPKETLPADAQFKGYKSVVVQDIQIRTNNVEFQKEVYYSPSLRKTFIADAPSGYEGGFGPVIKC